MTKKQVNELIKNKIGYRNEEEIEGLRNEYEKIIDEQDQTEKDFYYSVMCWWNDGNAPFYDEYLRNNWR